MAEAVVSFAVERLGELLVSEAKLLTGVNQQVCYIRSQLKEIQSFLKDADRRRGNQRLGRWVADVREVALMMEDVIEAYTVQVESRKGPQIRKMLKRFACIFVEGITLHEIGKQMRTIQDKVTTLTKTMQPFGLQALYDVEAESSNAERERQRLLRMSYSHLIEKDFIGMQEELQHLISHLINRDRGCEVVSVWGMGGLGKTTLVNKVYNHNNVHSHFQASAWVCLTQNFDQLKVLQDILKELFSMQRNEEIMVMGESELVAELYKVQKEKNCLVVIDDIWSLTDWQILRPAFPVGEATTGSKIMLTTRKAEVANVGYSYKLRFLSEEEGWKLLCMKAFPLGNHKADFGAAGDRVHQKKEEIGRNMVKKCQGLPLAISALGGLLKNKTGLREWEMVNKDICSNLNREGTDYGNVRQILALSYDDFPFRQKQLFLYLGNFREDENIETPKLYLLWIAEGMVCSSHQAKGEMLTDVAERYLIELAHRSLVQLVPVDEYSYVGAPWLKFKECRLHDLIRDLCLSKRKEEDSDSVIDFQKTCNESLDSSTIVHTEVRRLAVYLHDDADTHVPLEKQYVLEQLRSLIFFNDHMLPQKVENLKSFKLVRVLKLDKFKFRNRKLPLGLSYLFHLRYLSFQYSDLDELPSSIACLRYLETLDLRVSRALILSMPNVLPKLNRLKHLYLPYRYTNSGEILDFVGLNELELLLNVIADVCDIGALVKLTRLQVLKALIHTPQQLAEAMNFLSLDIYHRRYTCISVENFDLSLKPLEGKDLGPGVSHLTQLLESNSLNQLGIGADVGRLPKEFNPNCFSQSLINMVLIGCKYEDDPMVLLEKLPNLQLLILFKESYTGKELVCSANGFPRLKYFWFEELQNLEKWRIDEGAMPNICKLHIDNCSKLKMLPEGLKYLTLLRELLFVRMPKAFTDRVRTTNGAEGQDFYKVQHVPSITFLD